MSKPIDKEFERTGFKGKGDYKRYVNLVEYYEKRLSGLYIPKMGYRIKELREDVTSLVAKISNDLKEGEFEETMVVADFKKTLENCLRGISANDKVNVPSINDFYIGYHKYKVTIRSIDVSNDNAKAVLAAIGSIVLQREVM